MDIDLNTILQVVTLGGIVFAVWFAVRKPQEKSEVNDAVFGERFISLEKMVTNLRDNHLHTLDSKLDQHIRENQMVSIETTRSLTRMETLMEQLLKK
jgi:flagellar basal body-associated protein FliL